MVDCLAPSAPLTVAALMNGTGAVAGYSVLFAPASAAAAVLERFRLRTRFVAPVVWAAGSASSRIAIGTDVACCRGSAARSSSFPSKR